MDYILGAAEVQIARNNYAEAADLLSEKMAALPHSVSLKVATADVMLRLGKSEKAIELYEQALLLTDDNVDIAESLAYCYVFSGKWSEAAGIFNKLMEQCKDEQKRKAYLQVTALCSMNGGDYGRAAEYYSELNVKERNNIDIWVGMGRAALGAGIPRRALMCAERALNMRPGYPDAIVLLGCAQYADGDYDGAITSFERLTIDRKNAGFSWLMMARCYEQLGQMDRAEKAYNKALDASPDSELGKFLASRKDI